MSVRALLVGAAPALPGQIEFTTAGTHSWTVPEGVYSICTALIQGGRSAAASTLTYNGTLYCRAQNGARIGHGGGDGGFGGAGIVDGDAGAGGGGGGAGGYDGNGGNGGNSSVGSSGASTAGAANSGAAGGGSGAWAAGLPPGGQAQGGGGVGLKGKGNTGGPGGFNGSSGTNGTYGQGGNFGGGPPGESYGNPGYRGGALSYTNDIPVTPGTVVTVVVAGNGGGRILWGDNRFYPSTNTGDA